MGGGGFAQHAKNVTENNRALLRSKKRSRKTKEDVFGKKSVTKLHFKKSTRWDVIRVRKQMFIQKEKEKRRTMLAVVLTLLVIFLGYLLFK